MGKGIVPNDDVLGRAVSVLNIGSVVQPEIQVRLLINYEYFEIDIFQFCDLSLFLIQDLSNVNIKILEQPASNEHRFRYFFNIHTLA